MSRFDTLLIANRGEIVVRVARTAQRLGLRTVAIASEVDREAPHARACDACVPIAGERPADSYLRIDAVLDAARRSGAQAIHPGYGFLSENAEFAQRVIDAGLVWVGPPPDAMRAMGDKAAARQRMAAAGVPVLPGYDSVKQDAPTLRAAAEGIGYPLMIKACAGGGGRGMRLVQSPNAFDAALASAQSEAMAAFGDARVLLERAVLAPRHVEVQVFADAHGHALQLGERDCSVQRRHQKLIEEAPSPAVTPALRQRLGEAALQVVRDIGYVGAGTVEFLLEGAGDDARFWFMEMNTRLQVEHPVTEALLGVDLVEWQLRVAMGEHLPESDQGAVLQRYEQGGHAIEVRLCAEDPAHDHLPAAGTVQRWQAPPHLRCDHAVESGLQVSPYYDSMLAKLIAHAPHREHAAAQLAQALDHTVCLGLSTNRRFLSRVLRQPAFLHEPVTTAFLHEHPLPAERDLDADILALQALAVAALGCLPTAPLPMLWQGWTSAGMSELYVPLASGTTWHLSVARGRISASHQGHTHHIDHLAWRGPHEVAALVDGQPMAAVVVRDGPVWWLQSQGRELRVEDARFTPARRGAAAGEGTVRAPMHGRVLRVLVEPGASVEAGTLLAVMEAMKMEHQLVAPHPGVVRAVRTRVGDQVSARTVLVEIAAAA